MNAVINRKAGMVLGSLYIKHLSIDPCRDREEIIKHCKGVQANKTATNYGDPTSFNIDAIDQYLASGSFPSSYRASYKQENLTSWDKLILASQKFVENFFSDIENVYQQNTQRFNDVIKKIVENYGLDENALQTKKGQKIFLDILEKELAVRLNWFVKEDPKHSLSSATSLTKLVNEYQARKFFLHLLLSDRENIHSFLHSKYKNLISSIYHEMDNIPNMSELNKTIKFLNSYVNNELNCEPDKLIKTVFKVINVKEIANKKELEYFLSSIKDFCETKLYITNPQEILQIISYVCSMNDKQGVPQQDILNAFLDTLSFCIKNTPSASRQTGIQSLLLHLSISNKGKGLFLSYDGLTKTLEKSGKSLDDFGLCKNQYAKTTADEILRFAKDRDLTSDEIRTLNEKLFLNLNENLLILEKYLPALQKIWKTPEIFKNMKNISMEASEEHRKKSLIYRYYAKKIQEHPEMITKFHRIGKKTQIEIIEAANQYLTNYAALTQINEDLIRHFLGRDLRVDPSNQEEWNDLKQIASIGLMRAIDGFDPRLGNQFSTYAIHCINGAISHELIKTQGIFTFPSTAGYHIAFLRKKMWEQGLSPEEVQTLAAKLEIKKDVLKFVLTPPQVIHLQNATKDNDATERSDYDIVESREINPYDAAAKKDNRKRIRFILLDMMKDLDPREQLVLDRLFGLSTNGEVKTTLEVAAEISLTGHPISHQRVNQIKWKALNNLERILNEHGLANKIKKLLANEE